MKPCCLRPPSRTLRPHILGYFEFCEAWGLETASAPPDCHRASAAIGGCLLRNAPICPCWKMPSTASGATRIPKTVGLRFIPPDNQLLSERYGAEAKRCPGMGSQAVSYT